MPVRHEIDGSVLRLICEGEYPVSAMMETFEQALDDPRCPSRVAFLLDLRRSASLATRPAEEIRRVAEFLGPHVQRIGARCALLVETDVQFGLGRMGSVFAERVGVEADVFRDAKEALEWLGVEGSALASRATDPCTSPVGPRTLRPDERHEPR